MINNNFNNKNKNKNKKINKEKEDKEDKNIREKNKKYIIDNLIKINFEIFKKK